MSIYATLWELKFPKRDFFAYAKDDWVEIYAQGVPAYIDYEVPGIPPPVEDQDGNLRAVIICHEFDKKVGQTYQSPILVLTGEEYESMSFNDMLDKIREGMSKINWSTAEKMSEDE